MSYGRVTANRFDSIPADEAARLDGEGKITPYGGVWTDETAAACGYVPVIEERPALDPATQQYGAPAYTQRDGKVLARYPVEPIPAEQLALMRKVRNVDEAVATLRQWSSDARSTNVTQGNAVATLQAVVNRLGVFFDRFADLVESRR